eukprot:Clim_evm3s150 gene=Clim_evmTU3s150
MKSIFVMTVAALAGTAIAVPLGATRQISPNEQISVVDGSTIPLPEDFDPNSEQELSLPGTRLVPEPLPMDGACDFGATPIPCDNCNFERGLENWNLVTSLVAEDLVPTVSTKDPEGLYIENPLGGDLAVVRGAEPGVWQEISRSFEGAPEGSHMAGYYCIDNTNGSVGQAQVLYTTPTFGGVLAEVTPDSEERACDEYIRFVFPANERIVFRTRTIGDGTQFPQTGGLIVDGVTVCAPDSDLDGIPNEFDACPGDPTNSTENVNTDGDYLCDVNDENPEESDDPFAGLDFLFEPVDRLQEV